MTYKITMSQEGHKGLVRTGVDKLNAIIIPAEMKLKWPKEFESGKIKVIVEEE